MELISELRGSLNGYFKWNKARMTCFIQMLLALFTTRTVNLNKLACVINSKAVDQSSRYRRLQRFFSGFQIDFAQYTTKNHIKPSSWPQAPEILKAFIQSCIDLTPFK